MNDAENGGNTADSPEVLARTAAERGNLYGFLATVFREEVSADFLRQIGSDEFLAALAEVGANLDEELLKQVDDRLVEELAQEYTALFLGPGGHISPHESVQAKGGGGLLWGAETAEVKCFIEAAGFEYRPEFHGLPDHISVELEFMAGIAKEEAAAWADGNIAGARNCLDFEEEFLAKHLARWADAFCAKVRERATLSFYREMAAVTAGFIEAETAEIRRRLEIAAKGGRDGRGASLE